ncbi:phage tail domain-containing protein [Actinacidiphila oryziradicis]|uniref:phage tail domain-containing protein n=1 Tax=Actinacidiphila oryziradicis TaxID=2571141 RepID=UPI0023F111A2|nr:phage tail domain-containing protein [Actinacidiphila oryziradicis]MCW2873345.1 phage tail protein [Actinacidiphila oryziradicis]
MPLIAVVANEPAPLPPTFDFGPQPLDLTYIDPDGNPWSWSDPSLPVFATAVAGIGSPPIALTSLPLPGGGILAQAMTPQVRTITVGLYLYNDAADQDAFLDLCDQLTRALWTLRAGQPAPGTLIVGRHDGTSRQVQVLCTDPPTLASDDASKSGLTWASYVVTFQAPDPFWTDSVANHMQFGGVSGSAGVPPMPPVSLNPSTVLGAATVTNSGDADAYPVWTITGPGTPTLTNSTTGLSFGLDAALGAGEVVTVDTRPQQQSAVDGVGANRWADLTRVNPRALWALVPGDNQLNLQLTGAGVGSLISLSYVQRWLRG